MPITKIPFLILCFLFTISAYGQAIDNAALFRDVSSDKYFRLNYDNDYFTARDQYYTQGINIELVHPALRKFPVSKILIQPRKTNVKYGLSVEHDAYTPTSISHSEILYGDRPFAACLFLKTFVIAIDSLGHQRISSAFDLGVIGPYAFGENMQRSIHRWLNDVEPQGWSNQIQNDVILNYQVAYEKQLFSYKRLLSFNTDAEIRLGTLSDKASGGFTFMIGNFDSPFKTVSESASCKSTGFAKNFRFYFYSQPQLNFIGYDATLQGGVFNHSSPYTIPATDVTRITFQNNFGIAMMIGKVYLEYFQSLLTKEFSTGEFHRWGGIRLGVGF